MSIVVFLGPSLPLGEARDILNATYLPPVKMGDIYSVVQKKPSAIVIIDGLFEQTPAVWHKEILYAIDQNIPVFGGGSMGALRAAELHTMGMKGFGRIFEDFASGVLEDDDEVAVVHGFSQGQYDSQSEAMVNIRCALEQAHTQQVIDDTARQQLTDIAKGLFYPDRSWPALFFHAKKQAIDSEVICAVQTFVKDNQPNQKRDDAITVLNEVRQLAVKGGLAAEKGDYVFEHTVFWEHLVTYFSRAGDDGSEVSNERIRNHIRMADKDRDGVRQRAFQLFLIAQEARRIGLEITDDRTALQRFRYHRGLTSQPALMNWMKENGISKDECLAIARTELLGVRMEQRYAEQIDQNLKTVLQQDGKYADTVKKVAAKWRRVEKTGSVHLTEEQVGPQEDVLDWYQREYNKVYQQFDDHIMELGFTSMRQFLNELYAEYLDVTSTA
jgi:hypothetical protein